MKKIAYIIAGIALMTAMTACDTNEAPAPWEPGEASDSPGVYFANTDNILTVTVGEDNHVYIPLERLVSDDELTVPLEVTAESEEIRVPSEVTFAAGERCTDLVVELGDLPTKQLFALTIAIPDEYVNPYAAGLPAFDGSVIISDWEAVSDTPIVFEWADWDFNPTTILDPVEQVVMTLPGTNRYRILDFLHTGVDFSFELKPSEYALWAGYYRIVPMGNQVLYTAYGYTGYYNDWWLTDDDLLNWPACELTSQGADCPVYGISFFWYDDEYQNEYCYMRLYGEPDANGNLATRTFGTFTLYGFYTEDWDYADYTGYVRLTFELPTQS